MYVPIYESYVYIALIAVCSGVYTSHLAARAYIQPHTILLAAKGLVS